jgi:hypothetical protein
MNSPTKKFLFSTNFSRLQVLKFNFQTSHIFFYIIIFSLHFCSSFQENEIPKNPKDSYWQELADFLSAMPSAEKGRFAHLTKRSAYQSYSKNLNKYWNKIDRDYLAKITPFQKEYADLKYKKNFAFYPFSGADFVNLHAFYPQAQGYLMIGLEPIGKITNPDELNEQKFKVGLQSLENAIWEIASLNYFTRKRMRMEFANPYFSGTTPIIIFFMTRLGYKIDFVETCELSDSGDLVSTDNLTSDKPVAVKIYFNRNGVEGSLTYMKIFLKEDSSEQTTSEGKYFSKMSRRNLLLKSAEYELQVATYDRWINSVLSKTDMVVQDDSGIAFQKFPSSEWNAKVFGVYKGRFKLAGVPQVPDQADYAELMQKSALPLPFKYGYGALKGEGKSNLMIVYRKEN